MNETITQSICVLILAMAAGFAAYTILDTIIPVEPAPVVEEVKADNLTAGRYHQRTRTNDFFRRGRG